MCIACWRGIIELAQWDTAYINSLPDAAFAVIEPDYQRGKSKDKNARHLPHHAKGVKNGRDPKDNIDLAHLRNALARVDQIIPVTQSISKNDLVKKAKSHLQKHADDLKIGDKGKAKQAADQAAPEKSGKIIRVESLSAEVVELAKAKGLYLEQDGLTTCGFMSGDFQVDASKIDLEALTGRFQALAEGRMSLQDLRPKAEDFIHFPFRALSKIMIPGRFIDFSKGNVLKNSTRLLKGQTVYPDHEHAVGAWLGRVDSTAFDESKEPHGINADLAIYAFKDPGITQGLLAEPPIISNASVNVQFLWEKSHDMEDPEFFRMLGVEVEGEIVRGIVTKIESYGEISLVWKGADPTAKKLPAKAKVA